MSDGRRRKTALFDKRSPPPLSVRRTNERTPTAELSREMQTWSSATSSWSPARGRHAIMTSLATSDFTGRRRRQCHGDRSRRRPESGGHIVTSCVGGSSSSSRAPTSPAAPSPSTEGDLCGRGMARTALIWATWLALFVSALKPASATGQYWLFKCVSVFDDCWFFLGKSYIVALNLRWSKSNNFV